MASADGGAQPFATEAGAADAHLPPGSPPGGWRVVDRLVVLAFALALVIPPSLLAIGAHAVQLENRAPRGLPALSVGGLLDTSWPAGVDGFLTDRLALRPYAIRARGEAYWLTGGTGNPDAVRGLDDWLFTRAEFEPPCQITGAQLGAELEAANSAFTASGQQFRFILIPDKHTVYPEHVSPVPAFPPTCQDSGRAALGDSLRALGPAAIDGSSLLGAAAREPDARPLYYRQDTHWTPLGAATVVEALVRSLDPDLWTANTEVVRGVRRRVVDIAALIGLRHVERTPNVFLRPDVTQQRQDLAVPVQLNHAPAIFRITSSGSEPLLPGRTLVLYDSFFGIDTRLVAPFFADTTWVEVADMLEHPELARLLGPFDRVILERVERALYGTDVEAALTPLIRGGG